MAAWPLSKASNISASDTSLAEDSTMLMAVAVPATVNSISDNSAWATVGLMTISPLTRPTLTPATGPSNGMSDTAKAREAPNIAAISGVQSWSTDKTVLVIWISLRTPSGNIGRKGRSIKRLVKVAASDGRPSRLMKPPGTLPTAYIFSM